MSGNLQSLYIYEITPYKYTLTKQTIGANNEIYVWAAGSGFTDVNRGVGTFNGTLRLDDKR